MRKRTSKRYAILAAIPLLALTACGGDATDEAMVEEPMMDQMPAEPAAEMARVEITSPAEGATVPGTNIQVTLETHGATVEPADARRTPGRGHHHLFIDEDVSPGDAPIPPTSETVIHMGNGAEEFTIPSLAPGPHRIIAVFAYGDHVANPEVAQDTVNFTVAAQ